jgi:hypothetical protein
MDNEFQDQLDGAFARYDARKKRLAETPASRFKSIVRYVGKGRAIPDSPSFNRAVDAYLAGYLDVRGIYFTVTKKGVELLDLEPEEAFRLLDSIEESEE